MAKPKVALISGITGQDGAYLAHLLLDKGYVVHGIKRRSSQFNTKRLDHIYQDPHMTDRRFFLHYGDATDTSSIIALVQKIQPDEIYNLAAQSHVRVSFDMPEYTANVDAMGTLRFLEALRITGLDATTKFYQASTSELYGNTPHRPQNEQTPFYPRSPYGVAKLYSYWITKNYREAYGMFAVNGILFNHESPLRGETFLTRKVTRSVARISLGLEDCLRVGNLEARRDWGHAADFVIGMWQMMQQKKPDDFVLATGRTTSVRELVNMAFGEIGITLEYSGAGIDEIGRCAQTGKVLVRIDPAYFRPAEVDWLEGDASYARKNLGWKPQISLETMTQEMVAADLYRAKQRLGLIARELPPVEEAAHHPGGFLGFLKTLDNQQEPKSA